MKATPKGWDSVPLSDVCYRIVDGSHNPPKAALSGLPMLSARNIQNRQIIFDDFRLISESDFAEENKRTDIKTGDVLVTIVGAIGRTAVVRQSTPVFTLQRSVAVLKAKELHPNYLAYLVESPNIQQFLLENAKGTAQKGIYLKALGMMQIPLAPLPEQKRIADKLDATLARVDACRERLARVRPILKRFRQSVLAAAVSGRLTADWRAQQASNDSPPASTGHPTATTEPASGNPVQARSPDVAQQNPGNSAASPAGLLADERAVIDSLDSTRLIDHIRDAQKSAKIKMRGGSISPTLADISDDMELPTGWTVAGFDALAAPEANSLKAGPFGSALKKNMYVTTGYKIYGQEQVIAGSESVGDYFIDETKFRELESCAVKPGDILISLVGTIGRVLILSKNCCPGIINPRLVKLSLHHLISRSFISLYLCSPLTQKFFAKQSHGGTMDILNLGILRELPILLPPCKEQHEIVRRVDTLFAFADRLEARLQAAQAAAEQLTPALLAKASRGELVPQDPADEPASELLKRLAASRASADKPKRSRAPRQPA